MNGSVHVVMYTYYLLAAMGPQMRPNLWWKRYLTNMQLIQFIVAFAKNIVVATGMVSCGYPWQFATLTCAIMALFFGLFADFYLKEYLRKTKKDK